MINHLIEMYFNYKGTPGSVFSGADGAKGTIFSTMVQSIEQGS